MKVLYATQATGNGHLVRALELIPYIKKHVDLDIFVSGTQGQIALPFNVDYKKYGLSFVLGEQGGISYFRTAKSLKLGKLIRDIKQCNVRDYDLILNDFEPITAWAARVKKVKTVALSHQASFKSQHTPRPPKRNKTQEFILRHYAPAKEYMGFHFKPYDENIRTPIISRDIRSVINNERMQVSVYLPAYSALFLSGFFSKFPAYQWKIFSPGIKQVQAIENVEFHPVSRHGWLDAFAKSSALLIGAGFEGPSEAIHHGKKLMVIPMKNQYEQICNAQALKELGIDVVDDISDDFEHRIGNWLDSDKRLKLHYPDHSEEIILDLLNRA